MLTSYAHVILQQHGQRLGRRPRRPTPRRPDRVQQADAGDRAVYVPRAASCFRASFASHAHTSYLNSLAHAYAQQPWPTATTTVSCSKRASLSTAAVRTMLSCARPLQNHKPLDAVAHYTKPPALVDQCVTVQLDAAPSSSSSSAPSGRMPPAQHVILRRETRDFIATNSYRIAKTIASKADYEVRVCVGERIGCHLRSTYMHNLHKCTHTRQIVPGDPPAGWAAGGHG